MTLSNYVPIIEQNLSTLYSMDVTERSAAMGAELQAENFSFPAFGGQCVIAQGGVTHDGELQDGPLGIILSLYALNAASNPIEMAPFKAFKEFPDSMPYVGAFASHTEQILVPSVDKIILQQQKVLDALAGGPAPSEVGGDSAFLVLPLPKIVLCYIIYEADEDFPPSVKCLYSRNANHFMPMDGLADVGEYTSKAILQMISE